MRTDRFVKYAPRAARYLLTTLAEHLPGARRLVVTAPLASDDAGAEDDFTLSVDGATTAARGVVKLAGQLGGTADSPRVTGVQVSDGGSDVALSTGAVADGQALVRSGTSLVGQAVLARAGGTMTGALNMGGQSLTGLPAGAASGDAATYGQLTSMLNGLDWQRSVLSSAVSDPGTLSPSVGQRWLLPGTGLAGVWAGHPHEIAEKSATGWTFIAPNEGYTVHVDDEGVDYTFNGGIWISIGASIDHGSLLNLDDDGAHPQYQLAADLDEPGGYAGLDGDGFLLAPARRFGVGTDPTTPGPGAAWVNGPDLKFRDNQGTPATQIAERQSNRDQNGGYAGLDSNGHVLRPVRVIRAASDPGSPGVGEVWINGPNLKFRDNQGSPATQMVENQSNRDQNGGYPSLDGGGVVSRPVRLLRIGSDPGSPTQGEVWVNGPDLKFRDNQGTPATRVVVATGRQVASGAGLAGGGDLSGDRTLSIASFTGLVSKDIDPGDLTWSANQTQVHLEIDVGAEGQLMPFAIRLPPTVNGSLHTEAVFEFDDNSNRILENASTTNNLDDTFPTLGMFLVGDLNNAAANNGRRVRKIKLQTRNTTGSSVGTTNIGVFRIRAWAFPRGGGGAL